MLVIVGLCLGNQLQPQNCTGSGIIFLVFARAAYEPVQHQYSHIIILSLF